MASTRNGKLAKLAAGIASAAALAGLAGRFSTDSTPQEIAAPVTNRSEERGHARQWAVAPWDDDDDEWWHDHDDHEKKHGFDRFLAKPERRSGENIPPAAEPRTRTGRS